MIMRCSTVHTIDDIPPRDWNLLAGTANPFTRHEFLAALERNGCLGERWGWLPHHIVVHEADRLVGACPVYLKTNSYGEFVFDMAWADAYQRYGHRYFPKFVCAVPYTPVTGPRVMVAPEASSRAAVVDAISRKALELVGEYDGSGMHWLFTDAAATAELEAAGFMRRVGVQYHWHNHGYRDFDDFLSTLTSRRRKDIRRERRLARDSGAEFEVLNGHDATDEHWAVYHACYTATFDRKWGYATLSEAFFRELAATMPDNVVLVMVRHEGEYVAGAFNLAGDDGLFGRHWGTLRPLDYVHFEACYYQAIDYAIAHGLSRFEAGAQGEHKIQRGFLPQATYSAHYIREPAFRSPIADFLQRERGEMAAVIAELEGGSPYRQAD